VPGTAPEQRDAAAVGRALVDGLIVYSVAAGDALVTAALERRRPTVIVDQPRARAVPFIGIDDRAAAREAAGLASSETPVYECPGSSTALGHDAARSLLGERPRPTALLATSDQLALGAVEAARELGLAVPRDLSVVGFDDVPAASAAAPPLSSVHQDHAEKGRLAAEMLLALLRGEQAPRTRRVPHRLVIRASTGPPRSGA
jgi:DNA-binding LacI/PurR family transcriptional regulator